MFGSIGGMELLVIFALAFLLFGPRKLPEIGKSLGKTVAEFRRATQDFRTGLEREIQVEKIRETGTEVAGEVREGLKVAMEPGTLPQETLKAALDDARRRRAIPPLAEAPPAPDPPTDAPTSDPPA